MTSKSQPTESLKHPIEPRLGNKGRSIADRWVIRILIKTLHDSGQLLEASALIADLCADIETNVNETLKSEMGDGYNLQLNTPALRQDCKDRLRYLLDGMKAMREGQGSGTN